MAAPAEALTIALDGGAIATLLAPITRAVEALADRSEPPAELGDFLVRLEECASDLVSIGGPIADGAGHLRVSLEYSDFGREVLAALRAGKLDLGIFEHDGASR